MASSALDLLFKIRATDEASPQIKKLRSTFDAEVKAIDQSGKNAFLGLGNSVGASTSQMALLSKAMPLVATGIAAIAAAGVAAAAGLFVLAKDTAEFGSTIFDASQKTGLHAEALSALSFAAKQSGSSLSDLEVGIKVFTRTIGDAARGSDEAKDKLRRLGIDPTQPITDLQAALATAMKTIADAPEGILQMNAAMDAFGARSGPNAIATIRSFDGDLLKLIATAKALGVTLTDEDAKAADKFGDSIDLLKAQFAGIGYQIARQFMPEIQSAMEGISSFVKDNQETFRGWGRNIAEIAQGVIPSLKAAIGGLSSTLSLNQINWKQVGEAAGFWITQAGYVVQGLMTVGAAIVKVTGWLQESIEGWKLYWEWSGRVSADNPLGRRTGTAGTGEADAVPGMAMPNTQQAYMDSVAAAQREAKKKTSAYDLEQSQKQVEAAKARAQAIAGIEAKLAAIQLQTVKTKYDALKFEAEQFYNNDERKHAAYIEKLIEAENFRYTETQRLLTAKLDADKAAIKSDDPGIRGREAVALFEQALEDEKQLRQQRDQTITELEQKRHKAELDQQKASHAELLASRLAFFQRDNEIQAIYMERQIALIQNGVEQGYLAESDGIRRIQALRDAAARRDRDLILIRLQSELAALTTDEDRKKEIYRLSRDATLRAANEEIARLELLKSPRKEERELLERLLAIRHELAKADLERAKAAEEAQRRINEAISTEHAPSIGGENPGGAGGVDPNRPVTDLPPPPDISPWTSVFQTLRNVGMDAMRGLAQGIGAMVQNWVLLGNVGGQSMKKLVASTLAGVAAQAAILGVMELAYAAAGLTAWGRIQFGPPGPHLKSAAFFFAAAAAAGVLGRVVAGNSFAQSGAGGGSGDSGGGSGSFGGSTSGPTTKLIEQERNQAQRLDIFVHSNDSHILKVLQEDVRGNGWARQTFALKTET